MPADLGNLIQTGLGVFAIASLAGLGLMRTTVTNLRENLKDARDEITDKERRLTEAEAEIVKLNARGLAQHNDLQALGRVVTGETHWKAIGKKLDEHHNEAKTHWLADEEKLDQIRDALGGRKP